MISSNTPINVNEFGKDAFQVSIGDLVVDVNRSFVSVGNIYVSESSDIWELFTSCRKYKYYLTGDEEVYTSVGWVRVDCLNKKDCVGFTIDNSFVDYPDADRDFQDGFGESGIIFCPINHAKPITSTMSVVGLRILNGDSYSCDGLVVKSCQ